jgi:hypothetical protein
MDHGDCILRHLTDTEDLLAAYDRQPVEDEPGCISKEQILLEVSQLAWRALAYSQELHERFGSPLAPGAIEEHKNVNDIVYEGNPPLDMKKERTKKEENK